ncbi:hypothetical protein ACTG9Q_07275 [Actinokineospora sp. 24-640]
MSYPGPEQVAGWGAAQQPPPAPPAKKSKTPVIGLAAVAVLLAVAAGVFTALYFGQQSEADRFATERVEKQKEVDAANGDLAKAEDAAKSATDELEGHQSRLSSLRSEERQIKTCTEAARGYLRADRDTPESDKWFDKMYDSCR